MLKVVCVVPDRRPRPDADTGVGSRGQYWADNPSITNSFWPSSRTLACIMWLGYQILLRVVEFDGMSELRRHQSEWQEVLRTMWCGIAAPLPGLRQQEPCGNEILWGLRCQPNPAGQQHLRRPV